MNINNMINYLTENDVRYFHWNRHPGEEEMVIDLYDDRGGEWILKIAFDDSGNVLHVARTSTAFDRALEDATMAVLFRHQEDGLNVFGINQLSVDNIKELITASNEMASP